MYTYTQNRILHHEDCPARFLYPFRDQKTKQISGYLRNDFLKRTHPFVTPTKVNQSKWVPSLWWDFDVLHPVFLRIVDLRFKAWTIHMSRESVTSYFTSLSSTSLMLRGTQCQFLEKIYLEHDLRSRIVRTFVVKFHACLPLREFSNIYKMVQLPIFSGFLP